MSGAALRRNLWVIAGLALLLLGVGLFLTSPSGSDSARDFGWFAYTPLEEGDDFGVVLGNDFVIVSRDQLVAGLLAAVGLVVMAAGIGYRAGRGRRAEPGTP